MVNWSFSLIVLVAVLQVDSRKKKIHTDLQFIVIGAPAAKIFFSNILYKILIQNQKLVTFGSEWLEEKEK